MKLLTLLVALSAISIQTVLAGKGALAALLVGAAALKGALGGFVPIPLIIPLPLPIPIHKHDDDDHMYMDDDSHGGYQGGYQGGWEDC